MNKPVLKPRPFCGAEGKLFSHEMDGKTTIWWVQCRSSHCLARRQVKDSRAAAVAAPEPKVLKLAALADQRKTP